MPYGLDDFYIPGFGPPEEADPSLGTNVVTEGFTPYGGAWDGEERESDFLLNGRRVGMRHFEQGQNPFIGMHNNELLATNDQQRIADFRDDQRTRKQQAAVQIAAMIGGGTLLAGGGVGGGGGGNIGSTLGKAGLRGTATRSLIDAARGSFMPGETGGIPDIIMDRGRDAVTDIITGGEPGSGGSPTMLGRARDAAMDRYLPGGSPDIPTMVKDGSTALGTLGALANGGGGGSNPAPPGQQDSSPLRLMAMRRQQNNGPSDYFTYGRGAGAKEHNFFSEAEYVDSAPGTLPPGGAPNPEGTLTGIAPPARDVMRDQMLRDPRRGVAARARGGQAVRGEGSGRDDTVEALLSDGEYVMDAETVAMLGDGSVDAGAKRLDQLRSNLRKHKGAALAKGKFSPNARPPEGYLPKSKGGTVRRAMKGAQAERARRVADALAKQVGGSEKDAADWAKVFEEWGTPGSGSRDASLRSRANQATRESDDKLRKARGGAIRRGPAFREMTELADRFERALGVGDRGGTIKAGRALDAKAPGFSQRTALHFAKGGSVARAMRQFRGLFEPPRSRLLPPEEGLPPVADTQPKNLEEIVNALELLEPRSGALRQYQFERRRKARPLKPSPKEPLMKRRTGGAIRFRTRSS